MAKDKPTRYFLIDYENVHMAGLQGLEDLRKSDRVIVFYSQNADSLSFDVMRMISATRAHVDYIKVDTQGRNALDFQLSSYIGFLLGKDRHCKCYIVSRDKGYNNVQIFWFKQGEMVRLIPSISERKAVSVKKSDIEDALSVLKLSEEDKEQAAELVWKHLKTGSPHLSHIKVSINNELVQQLGGDKTKVIYDAIRPLMK
ncbi:MAG: hypothetical protein IJV58_10050 [Oscillospiraceae bacterium]|jgi:hypothetical protein|nr:hypothetical protein [Oscillospiraceae bacterium]MBR1458492.1 hypothetical protein [Oscillospiraceae bacterium]MBR1898970.1 hypothetical protein [Oscillospiraceae bacterium]